ncbi:hypothetical protein KSF_051720 [Reticulibacter mediterranei]|uniref:Uncharacterized protein n=1 Tax=Reticulibacter mediterranei TaxID=2778369 RepID=A0A8J3N1F7_9CHLR|nr:hypothetical protein KSF_051720 [Reticulibacter mediterranei]
MSTKYLSYLYSFFDHHLVTLHNGLEEDREVRFLVKDEHRDRKMGE